MNKCGGTIILNSTQKNEGPLTWMQAIAGDTGPFQAVCELTGKEHIAEFAVAVGSERVPGRLTCDQILVRVEEVEVDRTQPMQQGRHVDDAAVLCLL